MKNFKKLLALSFCLVVLTSIFSCSKDDDTSGPRNVEFRVTASSNASISTVVHSNAQGQATTLTTLSGNTWSTKVTVNADVQSLMLGANASTPQNTTGTLKVEILIDGVVVKEATGSGQILTASTTHIFVN